MKTSAFILTLKVYGIYFLTLIGMFIAIWTAQVYGTYEHQSMVNPLFYLSLIIASVGWVIAKKLISTFLAERERSDEFTKELLQEVV